MHVIAFLLSCYGDHRDLHSFPTRRSSDLCDRLLACGRIERQHPGAVLAQPVEKTAVAEHEDRKSTRLNSSHVEISYAVFCLKKKNTMRSIPESRRHAGESFITRSDEHRAS